MKVFSVLILLTLSLSFGFSQEEIKRGKLFDENRVHRIDIKIDTADLALIYNNADSTIIKPVFMTIQYEHILDSIENLGFRIKGNTSRFNKKKSFKLSFNEYEKGRKYRGLKKLNLNAYWNDPSHLRAHLASQIYNDLGVAVARSGFTELYINGDYFGLYNLGEHIDTQFTKRNFDSKKGDLYKCLGLSDLTYQGDDIEDYIGGDNIYNYELKFPKDKEDYTSLMAFIKMLNETPIEELECTLRSNFSIDDYIKIMAVDIAIANWDGYIFAANNYYLYHNPKENKIEFIPYDFDNTFGMDWVGKDWTQTDIYNWNYRDSFYINPDSITGIDDDFRKMIEKWVDIIVNEDNRPLYSRVLEVENFRNQFNFYLDYLVNDYLVSDSFNKEFDRLFEMLAPSIERDTMDNFTWTEVEQSIDKTPNVSEDILGIRHNYLPYGMKEFITLSNENIGPQIEEIKPLVVLSKRKVKIKEDFVQVKVKVETNSKIKIDLVVLQKDGKKHFNKMNDKGKGGDKEKEDGIYSLSISPKEINDLQYYFEVENNGIILRDPCVGYYID